MQRTHFGRRRRENSRAQARLASASGTSPTCPHATGLDQELLASTACGGLIIRRSWVRVPPAPPAVLMLGSGPSWTGSWIDVGGTVHGAAIRSTRSGHIEQRLPAVPTLADPGYDGAGTGIHIRSSSPLLAGTSISIRTPGMQCSVGWASPRAIFIGKSNSRPLLEKGKTGIMVAVVDCQ